MGIVAEGYRKQRKAGRRTKNSRTGVNEGTERPSLFGGDRGFGEQELHEIAQKARTGNRQLPRRNGARARPGSALRRLRASETSQAEMNFHSGRRISAVTVIPAIAGRLRAGIVG